MIQRKPSPASTTVDRQEPITFSAPAPNRGAYLPHVLVNRTACLRARNAPDADVRRRDYQATLADSRLPAAAPWVLVLRLTAARAATEEHRRHP